MAHDLAALIDTLKLRDVTVVGWAMGAAVAAQVAVDHPAHVRRIVLMSAPAPGTTFGDVMKVPFPASVANAAGACFRDTMFVPADYRAPRISAAVTQGQLALLRAWERDDAAADALRHTSIDTLVMPGDDDAILPVQNADVLANRLPTAQLLVVRAAGHAMMYQYPHALASAIDRFIAQAPAHPLAKPAG